MTCTSCRRSAEWKRTTRGLCPACYKRHHKRGTLHAFPGGYVPREVVVSEYEHLRESRVPVREMPARIGVSRVAFRRAMHRAKAAGDSRAATFGDRRRTA